MIGDTFFHRLNERLYVVQGILPLHEEVFSSEGALVVMQETFEARLMPSLLADAMAHDLVYRAPVNFEIGNARYAGGTPFVLYRVPEHKGGKLWATPYKYFHNMFMSLDEWERSLLRK